MCGISGIIANSSSIHDELIEASRSSLHHRGPDAFGYQRVDSVVSFAHNRLRILDVSERSDQPFSTTNGHLIYNGEIYNYRELRRGLSLEGRGRIPYHFLTDSDTEVLAAGLSLEGTSFLNDVEGMYSLAWFDQNSRSLYLSTDIFGVKQVYYYRSSDLFVFASEFEFLCKFIVSLGISLEVNSFAVDSCYSMLAPCLGSSLFSSVQRLLPGELLRIALNDQISASFPIDISSTFVCADFFKRSQGLHLSLLADKKERLFSFLNAGMEAQTPTAILCSGGIDSTIISISSVLKTPPFRYPLLASEQPRSKDGFSSDADFIPKVADVTGLPLEVCVAKPFDWSRFCEISDLASCPGDLTAAAPLQDLCSAANVSGFKVLLSGLGADEVFSGYRQHQLLAFYHLPNSVRSLAAAGMRLLSASFFLPASSRRRLSLAAKLLSLSVLRSSLESMSWGSGSPEMYSLFSSGISSYAALIGIELKPTSIRDARLIYFFHFLASTHLPITDSISMKSSVELRPLFLQKRIIKEFFDSFSIANFFFPKYLLKRILLAFFPPSFVLRRKAGFGSIPDNSASSVMYSQLLTTVEAAGFLSPELLRAVRRDSTSPDSWSRSRSIYGLISLAHSVRLIRRISPTL